MRIMHGLHLSSLAFLMLTLYSCSKNSCIKGVVRDASSNSPIEHAQVSYTEDYGLLNSYSATMATGYTDSKGEFRLQWDNTNKISTSSSLSISKKGYYYLGNKQDHFLSSKETYYMNPSCFIKMKIKNINPHNDNDYIGIIDYPEFGTNPDYNESTWLEGMDVDTTIILERASLRNDSIVFDNFKAQTDQYTDTVLYLPPYDTVFLSILY